MLPEFQLWLAMTEISARNCLEWPLLISEVSRASPKKTISEEKLMIARLLNVVNVCGSSFIWILFFCKRHILWSKDSTICNTFMFAVNVT